MKLTLSDDLKEWCALSCPTTGLRFDARTLELMDTDRDGRIRADEVRAAVKLIEPYAADSDGRDVLEKRLADNLVKQADVAKLEPSAADRKALSDWERAGNDPHIIISGLDAQEMSEADAALAAVEPIVEAFFTPPDDMPLVTEAPDVELPLDDHLNPKHQEAILAFAAKCVKPVLGERSAICRLDWKAVKAAFAPYRAWVAAKPVVNATAKEALVAEERVLRYRLHLGEFIVNFATMEALYGANSPAIFQTGVLRIDGKELHLCFHVENEAAHAALAERSKCCVVYAKLTRPGESSTRQVCAVVTAGRIAGLYAGRNGVFFDRDGKDWEAVVTKVVAAEVSLAEAFWSPWRKLGESVSGMVRKYFADRDAAAKAKLSAPSAATAKEGGAAMASSVAAIGIGVGMLGAAAASLMAALSHMAWYQIAGSALAIVLVVSLPSVVLTWFALRRRDLGAILNACGWAVNRPLRFSVKKARSWTICARPAVSRKAVQCIVLVFLLAVAAVSWYHASHRIHELGERQCPYCTEHASTTK